jgi:hypothetical protein
MNVARLPPTSAKGSSSHFLISTSRLYTIETPAILLSFSSSIARLRHAGRLVPAIHVASRPTDQREIMLDQRV